MGSERQKMGKLGTAVVVQSIGGDTVKLEP